MLHLENLLQAIRGIEHKRVASNVATDVGLGAKGIDVVVNLRQDIWELCLDTSKLWNLQYVVRFTAALFLRIIDEDGV